MKDAASSQLCPTFFTLTHVRARLWRLVDVAMASTGAFEQAGAFLFDPLTDVSHIHKPGMQLGSLCTTRSNHHQH